jgi:putative transposase
MAMLEGFADLTLEKLNAFTQAWVEQEYQRMEHKAIGTSPLRRYLDSPSVGRDCPDSNTLRQAFRLTVTRRQRRSDGTIALAGKRFEIPSRYNHLEQVPVRYARWDLRHVDLVDPHTQEILCPLYPLDKAANANGVRRRREATDQPTIETAPNTGVPPLLHKLLEAYAATGRPPAYLPKNNDDDES